MEALAGAAPHLLNLDRVSKAFLSVRVFDRCRPHEARFAGAVLADDAKRLALIERQGHLVEPRPSSWIRTWPTPHSGAMRPCG